MLWVYMEQEWALLTEEERENIQGDSEVTQELVAILETRIDAFERDVAILATHEPDVLETLEAALESGKQAGVVTADGSGAGTLGEFDFDGNEQHKEAVYGALNYVQTQSSTTASEIIENVMPVYPMTYDISSALRQAREGNPEDVEWWEETVKPGLEKLPPVERKGQREWMFTGEE